MKHIGKAHKYGDNINTDLIIAGKYTKTLNLQDLAAHCFEDLDPDFIKRVKKGDILVAGHNFGCGSSREQAPLAIKHAGIDAVIAKSFARIFFRNAINIGLTVVTCDTSIIKSGDVIMIDHDKGELIINDRNEIRFQRLPPIMQDILKYGGLVSYLKEKKSFASI